ncbi:MAG: hypothetical protein LQ340_003749 [Diploschistes diacapsis]|nr:MAG: hypothetical protein LQ340_003749 [Diploschistes diacapsis]
MDNGSTLMATARDHSKTEAIPSSSPAFGTPVYPIQKTRLDGSLRPSILPVLIPPASLRPLAFRTVTKKHGLTLTSSALQALATFVGKSCGSGWREEGLAEKVLEEMAKTWKRNKGNHIIEGDSQELREILKLLEGSMHGGRFFSQHALPPHDQIASMDSGNASFSDVQRQSPSLYKGDSTVCLSAMDLDKEEDVGQDPRKWFRVVGAFDQPRLSYNPNQKHFEKDHKQPSLLPTLGHKTLAFRNRYNIVHQRILRNESFLTPTVAQPRAHALQRSASTIQQHAYKITPIANLLGRSGSSHVLLGLLTTSPTGGLAISDLTGNVILDLSHAKPVPENGSWFCSGMIVIVDGIYEEDRSMEGLKLGGGAGVGGTIGGKFVGTSIGGPPCERRETSLGLGGLTHKPNIISGGGFGWVDFLGVGSERASGPKMRLIEKRLLKSSAASKGRNRIVCLGELMVDNPKTLQALRHVLGSYATEKAEEMPLAFVLTGNFVTHAAMSGGRDDGSIEYKESFDLLASTLSEYPTVLQAASFVFVPGDNDPWPSSFSKGAATVVPRNGVPDLFTSRVRKAFAGANSEADRVPVAEMNGEAVWTSNPARMSLFGPVQEIVVFRDDISGRLRRSAVPLQSLRNSEHHGTSEQRMANGDESQMEVDVETAGSGIGGLASTATKGPSQDIQAARKLVKTILDQGHLSPFPLSSRPVLWDWAGSLQLYPLPSAFFLVDAESPPFAITYEGCHVMNPGRLVADSRKSTARWVEYDAVTRRGTVREEKF